MPASLTKHLAVLLATGALFSASCLSSAQEERLTRMSEAISELARHQRESDALNAGRIDTEVSRIWGKLNCNDEQVRTFIKECESADSTVCSDSGLASALAFMNSQAVVTMYLRPDLGVRSLQPVRQGQLLGLTDLRFLFPSTRFLILAQPRSDSQAHQDEAEKIGRQLLRYIRTELKIPPRTPIIGPRILPCKLKQEQLRFYGSRLHMPQVNEPTEKEPRVRLWLYRTDCL